jgi:hypothetical protein
LDRIKFAAGRILNKSVAILDREDWHRLILPSGEVTKLAEVPEPISGVTRIASIVAIIACGFANPAPRIELARYDPKDKPNIYNIDRYTVIQTLNLHPKFGEIIVAAGVQDNDELNNFLRDKVLVVGPEKPDYHWVQELPDHIRDAKLK